MPDCRICKDNCQTISAMEHEADMERQQEDKKHLWIVIVILIVALILSNAGWIYYASQFEEVSENTTVESYEATVDGNGNAVVNGYGEISIG